VLVVEESLFSRPGPRSVEAVEMLARFLHPDAGWGLNMTGDEGLETEKIPVSGLRSPVK
jgi:hypothetical protein